MSSEHTTTADAADALGSDESAAIHLNDITKRFDDLVAVDDLDLTIRPGEFLVLLGPSGCGKSTTLRMIAGLEVPSEGSIEIGDREVTETLPQKRDLSMVFQSYALYPHKTVEGNLAFPLGKLDLDDDEEERRIQRTAELLEIDDLLDNKPGQLSGGQRQRVALGRTIVREPKAFLMDEPLSNLDAKLRVQTRSELRSLQQQLGTTTVYVTHDQEEAMSLADRIAVMNDGKLQQVGTPKEVYENPVNEFVAGFLGEPAMNFLEPDQFDAPGQFDAAETVGVRPEDVEVAEESSAAADGGHYYELDGEALVVEPLGNAYEIEFDCGGEQVTARLRERPETVESGTSATLRLPAEAVHRFGEDGEVIGE
ncbi:sorbitol ABC transporter ATP-binding protein /mannitol ABC transporter ATP-binding protein [Natronoarchaeum philippinense]|uniref:ABC-type D-xylose/L-arabinose transporter n=1 Tax=Natronoarchaeum philippinense TaxID=558529 RepID=A0A285NSK5_NATPI|nr:ABC transporter ATP-binding protein [Natronoarchaeum philippinense]SNZ12449.1 sorbitol ABC transporter ATP-binding protein /mannitol ABC transporter ATP-binding protein [Natronoarchaeum philippinense]